jgi:hypothetical protein
MLHHTDPPTDDDSPAEIDEDQREADEWEDLYPEEFGD